MTQREKDAYRMAALCWRANQLLTDYPSAVDNHPVGAAQVLVGLADLHERALRLFGSNIWEEAIERVAASGRAS